MTNIEMEWTDSGAKIISTVAVTCPACKAVVSPGVEHRCGDMVVTPKKRGRKK